MDKKSQEYLNTQTRKAVYEGNLIDVGLYLDMGADANEAMKEAIQRGHIATVKFLLEEKAVDVNKQDVSGRTYLMQATKLSASMYNNSLSSYAAQSWEYLAKSKQYLKVAKLLLKNGANANIKDDYGKTALEQVEAETEYGFKSPAAKLLKKSMKKEKELA